MSTSALPDLLAGLWQRFADTARTRVAVVEEHVASVDLGVDDADLRAAAASAAHQLCGALGSYGRRGSPEAARLQDLLEAHGDPEEVRALVRVLRDCVKA